MEFFLDIFVGGFILFVGIILGVAIERARDANARGEL